MSIFGDMWRGLLGATGADPLGAKLHQTGNKVGGKTVMLDPSTGDQYINNGMFGDWRKIGNANQNSNGSSATNLMGQIAQSAGSAVAKSSGNVNRYASSVGGGGGGISAAQAAAEAKRKAQNEALVNQGNADHARTQTSLDARLRNADGEYNQTIDRYNQDMNAQRNKYNEQVHTNDSNLAKNKHNALLAQVQGRRGLRSAMAAAGALSGDGEVLMNRAVKNALDKDVDGATNAYAQNAQQLNTAWRETEEEDRQRREDARAQHANNRQAAEADIFGERNKISRNIANAYRELGNTAQAQALDARAQQEADAAAARQGKQYAKIMEKKVAFSPAELEQYLAGAGDMSVKIGDQGTDGLSNTSANILKALSDEEKRKQLGVVERV